MTESQQALYGGALWVGPVFLLGSLLLYFWLSEAPFTKWGKRRARERNARLRKKWAPLAQRERAAREELKAKGYTFSLSGRPIPPLKAPKAPGP